MARKKQNTKNHTVGAGVDEEGFEIIGGDSAPMAIGEVVEGVFGGVVRSIKGRKGMVPIFQIGTRTILGNAVLASKIKDGNVKEGDYLRVTRLEDGTPKKGQNPPKMFQVGVKRAN
jgi:hypothetical protein